MKKRIKNLTDDQISYYLELIDSNRNGTIDELEYFLATATEDEDLLKIDK